MENSELAFLEALRNITVIQPIDPELRLHYNAQGDIYMATMQDHPRGTNYLVVNQEQYDNYFRYRVVCGNISKIN